MVAEIILVASCYGNWNKRWPNGPLGITSTSELSFASFFFSERLLVLNVSHEKDLIFMRINIQVTHIFIPIVSHKSFYHKDKSKLGIRLFIHELLREPLIGLVCFYLHFKAIFGLIGPCLQYLPH